MAKPSAAERPRPQSAQPAQCRRAAASRPGSAAAPATASRYAAYVSSKRPPEPIAYEWSRGLGCSDGGWVACGADMRGGGLWRDPAAAPPRKRAGRTALGEALGDASQPGDAVRRARGGWGGRPVSFLGIPRPNKGGGGGGTGSGGEKELGGCPHGDASECSYYDDEYEYDDEYDDAAVAEVAEVAEIMKYKK